METGQRVTVDELYDAYLRADLRRLRIGFQTAILTPSIRIGLWNSAIATKKQQHGTPAPTEQASTQGSNHAAA